MTTRGIEDQYKAYDEAVDEMNRLTGKLLDAIDGEEIPTIIAALCMAAVDVIHQDEDIPEEQRLNLLVTAIVASWKDYHNSLPPPTEELH